MTPDEMKKRTRSFALRCVKLAASFSKGAVGDVIGRQLIKASTSVAANYRASCAARSHADFVNKLSIVEEEADESAFWVEFAAEAGLVKCSLVEELIAEGGGRSRPSSSPRRRQRRQDAPQPSAGGTQSTMGSSPDLNELSGYTIGECQIGNGKWEIGNGNGRSC